MIKRLYGVNIAVKDENFEAAVEKYKVILGVEPKVMGKESFALPGHRGANFALGDIFINVIAGEPGSTTANLVEKRGEGLQLISLETTDIEQDMKKMAETGVVFTSDKPIPTASGSIFSFAHPKSTHGVQIELGQLKT